MAAVEILIATHAVRNLIREGKTYQIHDQMEFGGKDGMQTLDQALNDLVKRKVIEKEQALMKSSNPNHLEKLLQLSER